MISRETEERVQPRSGRLVINRMLTACLSALAAASIFIAPSASASTLVVTNANDGGAGSLRNAIKNAKSGDTIVFASSLKRRTIQLTSGVLAINKSLDMEGPGAGLLAISGNAASRVFGIKGGVSVTLAGLTITNGLADHGGGILDEPGASLTLSRVVLANNQAAGGLGGGAIFNDTGARLSIANSSLANNQATTAVTFDPATGGGGGGAIFNNFGATVSLSRSDLSGNQAATTIGFDNFGGALYNLGGTATLTDCTLENNQASGGGSSTIFGGSSGGAVANDFGAVLTVTGSSFTSNQAICASGGFFTLGGVLDNELSTATISYSRFTDNQSHGGDGSGSFSGGYGGAIENSALTLGGNLNVTYSTFTGNQAIGADGGGIAGGGAIDTGSGSNESVSHCTFTGNRAMGGDGGVATDLNFGTGNGLGGAMTCAFSGTYSVDSCTFTGNQAIGASGASGGSGAPVSGVPGPSASFQSFDNGEGGALWIFQATVAVSGSTFTDNQALGGSNAIAGPNGVFVGNALGGGLENEGMATVMNCTFDHNQAVGGSGNTGGSAVILVGGGAGGAINDINPYGGTTLTASNLTLSHNQAVGGAGNSGGAFAGEGIGGGLSAEVGAVAVDVSNISIERNRAVGGPGADGGSGSDGLGGGLANLHGCSITLNDSIVDDNQAEGGAGGDGGDGLGGGIYNDGSTAFGASSLTVTGSTVIHNKAQGGEGNAGGSDGQGVGGGVYLAAGSAACKDASTVIAFNHASTSNDDVFGIFTICP
jgi:hypothetical protein